MELRRRLAARCFLSLSSFRLLVSQVSDLLLAGCLRGEPAAQTAFYRHFAPELLGVCLRYAHSRADAQDILQEAFIRIFERLRQYQGNGALEGWLRRVVVTTAVNHYRTELRYWKRNVDLTEANHVTADGNDLLSQLSAQELLGLISQLPTGYRLGPEPLLHRGLLARRDRRAARHRGAQLFLSTP